MVKINIYHIYYYIWPYGQAVKTSPSHGGFSGSNPDGVTKIYIRPYGQAVKTPPFHGGIPGSNPGRVTIMTYHHLQRKWNEGQMSRRFKVS